MKNFDMLKEKMHELQVNIPLRCKYYFSNPLELVFRPHWHDRLEILMVKNGSLNVTIDGESITVNEGQAAVISPCMLHTATSGKNGANYQMLMLDLSLLKNNTPLVKRFTDDIIATRVSFNKIIDDEQLRSLAESVSEEYKNNPSPVIVQGYIYTLLGILQKNYSIHHSSIKFTAGDKISAVTDYITEHYREPLTTGKLSNIFGYTEAYFCRRFKQETNLTPMQYLKITRLEHAKNLLKLGAKVSETAAQCGFSDPIYFSKCFKKQYGLTPGEYSVKKLDNMKLEINE